MWLCRHRTGRLRALGTLVLGAALTGFADSGGEVQVSLHGISLRLDPATAKVLGSEFRSVIGSAPSATPNGELMPLLSTEPFTHGGYLLLTDPLGVAPVTLSFGVDIPAFADQNGNGLNDFFEVDQAVAATSMTGSYEDPFGGEGPIQVTWSRPAGAEIGICELALVPLGLKFAHRFHLTEYRGAIEYTNTPRVAVSGWLGATEAQHRERTLAGPIQLCRLATSALDIPDATLTNDLAQPMPFVLQEPLQRAGTNYLGFLVFADGDPTTPEVDFVDYVVIVSDARDADGNGVPDVSDLQRPHPARVTVRPEHDTLVLRIEGSVGFDYTIEAAETLEGPWVEGASVTMEEPVEDVRVARPWNVRFWRVKAD